MKVKTSFSRVTQRSYVLSSDELKDAVTAYVDKHKGVMGLPSHAREEREIEFGDSHNDCLTLTRRFIYNDGVDSAPIP